MAIAAMVTPEGAHGYSWSNNHFYSLSRLMWARNMRAASGMHLAHASLAQVRYVLPTQVAELSHGWRAFWWRTPNVPAGWIHHPFGQIFSMSHDLRQNVDANLVIGSLNVLGFICQKSGLPITKYAFLEHLDSQLWKFYQFGKHATTWSKHLILRSFCHHTEVKMAKWYETCLIS